MNLKDIFDNAKAQPLLLDLLPDAENGGKICPHHNCDGGQGKSKTGATKFTLPNGQERLGCFKCKAAGRNGNFSNVDIAAYHLGISVTGAPYSSTDTLEIAKFLANHFGYQLDGYTSPVKNAQASPQNSPSNAADVEFRKAEIAKIVAADVARYRKSPVPVPEKFARAISQSTFERYGVTYDEKWYSPENRLDKHFYTPQKRIIFLCGNSYVARLADQIDDYPEYERKYLRKAYNGGAVEIFNVAAIDEAPAGSVIYAVEGIFDALSLLQIGAENVVAINGAPHWRKLVERIKARSDGGKTLHVAVLFDDDDAGRPAAENTRQALIRAGVPAIARFLPRATNDTSDEKNDANFILQHFGADALRESFFHALENYNIELASIAAEIKNLGLKLPVDTETLKTVKHPENDAPSALKIDFNNADSVTDFQDESAYFAQNFDEDVQRRRKFANRKTGFANIDEQQIFTPGLYILGGLPSIGKTSFAWQLADNLASAGEPVLYVSYEMSIAQLRAKTIAHRVYEIDHDSRLSSAQIAIGGWNRTVGAVVDQLKKSTRIFRTLQATSVHFADKLIALLDRFCASLIKPPVIFIDYLQRMPRPSKTDLREGVSFNARSLKDWQLKSNATIIALSSLNRDNYSAPISFESFKETGEIEYSADVMWGLQLYCVNRATGKIFADRQAFSDAKKQQPREMQLLCVKNREGNVYDCFFHYFSAVDTFIPCAESDFEDTFIPPPEPIQTIDASQLTFK